MLISVLVVTVTLAGGEKGVGVVLGSSGESGRGEARREARLPSGDCMLTKLTYTNSEVSVRSRVWWVLNRVMTRYVYKHTDIIPTVTEPTHVHDLEGTRSRQPQRGVL